MSANVSSVRGVSLIESVLCISLLLLAVVLVMNLLPASWVAGKGAEQRLYAANLAQSLLEEQRAARFDTLASATLPTVQEADTLYAPSIEVVPVPGKPRLKTVRARVRWTTRGVSREEVREVDLCDLPR